MRYIRTKDGNIFEIEKELGKYGKSKAIIICDFNGNVIDVEKQNMILKQADTIEELCDEFVLVAPYRFKKPKTATELEKDFDEMRSFYTSKDDKIYGAIWIKGEHGEPILKSVAKMNEKGELELLCH